MRGLLGVIEVAPKGGGRLGEARAAVGAQRVGEPGEVLAGDAVFKARKGGARAKAWAGSRGGRSTLRCNSGSCRRLWASLPSAYPAAL